MGILDKMKGKKPAAAKKATSKKADKAEETTAVATEAKAARGPLAREGAGESYRILVRPVMTEKTAMQLAQNQYTFVVAAKATKVDVARAISDLYGVKPTQVRIVNLEGKMVRFGRTMGREKNTKKAVVTLKKGDTLSL
jgi:large subunit ribosomal protein L23